MNKNIYEIGFLINPDLSQQEASKTAENIKNILSKQSASVISEGEVVDIDLAYQIITKIASKNVRFDKAYFTWVKFESEGSALEKIKKEVDKIKSEVFRYLITKTVADDQATDKYQDSIESEEVSEDDSKEEKQQGDVIDTTSEEVVEDAPEKEEVSEESSNVIPDDLTKVEGIGPKIQEALYEAGVKTFAQLADKTSEEISEIIADVRGSHDAGTWPKQAQMAADGKWDELKEWQDQMDGGKE